MGTSVAKNMSRWRWPAWSSQLAGPLAAIADQGMASAASLILGIAVARTSGATGLAMYGIALTGLLMLTGLHLALVIQPLQVQVPGLSERAAAARLARLAGWHVRSGLMVVPVALVLLTGPQLLGSTWGPLAAVAVLAAWTRTGGEFLRRSAYARLDPRRGWWISLAGSLPPVAVALVTLGCSFAGSAFVLSPFAAISAWAVGGFLAVAVGRLLLKSELSSPPEPAIQTWQAHWGFGRWAMLSTVALWLTGHAFTLVAAAALGLVEAGWFHAVRTVLGLPLALLLAVDALMTPRAAAALAQGGEAAFRRVADHQAVLALVLVVPPALAMAFFPHLLLTRMFGEDFAPAVPMLRLAGAVAVAGVLDRMVALRINVRQRPAVTLAGFAVAMVVTVALLPILLPQLGASACVWLLLLNTIIMTVVPGLLLWLGRQR